MRQILAWICLGVVGTTTAYGLQFTATAITAPAAAVTGHLAYRYPPGLIVAVDPVAGDVH